MENPSFADLAKFIREWVALPRKKQIVPDTRFEEDLGITGDDGCELLEAIQKHFNAPLCEVGYGYRRTFDLGPDEYLFNSEGLFGSSLSGSVRDFTVGQLYDVVLRTLTDTRKECRNLR